jgi:hypothetical protein
LVVPAGHELAALLGKNRGTSNENGTVTVCAVVDSVVLRVVPVPAENPPVPARK